MTAPASKPGGQAVATVALGYWLTPPVPGGRFGTARQGWYHAQNAAGDGPLCADMRYQRATWTAGHVGTAAEVECPKCRALLKGETK